jgi:hypothetical protein
LLPPERGGARKYTALFAIHGHGYRENPSDSIDLPQTEGELSQRNQDCAGPPIEHLAGVNARRAIMKERVMSKWLSPRKMLDYHVVRRFEDVAEAERQLYLAVVRGDVRARLNGKVLGPEWLKQLCRMKISDASSFALPPDIELAAEDAPRV